MKLTVLGSGTCVPNKYRGSSGYLLELGNNKILFDCGNGTTWKLEKIGVNYLDIDYIFITHFHPDHTADLIPLLFATKYPYPYNIKRSKPLIIYGPEGFNLFYDKLKNLYGDWVNPENVQFKEIKGVLKTNDFTIKTFRTVHTNNSICYQLINKGKKFVYSGDTGYFKELSNISDNADLFIIECALPDNEKLKMHISPSDLKKILKNSNPKKVLVTHFYP
ncbi:MAG: MBL fold metallo-hydrolase, partial [Thermodesulfobacteriota bacterium]